MEKTKEQILIEMLRKAGLKMRDGRGFRGGRGPGHKFGPEDGVMRTPPMRGPIPDRMPSVHGGIPDRMPPMHGPMPDRMPPMHGPVPPFRGMHPGKGPGFFPREGILLAVLEAGEGGARQKDIAEKIGINPSSLSEQIDRLEADRYLERIANPDDRRSTLLVLTEKGKARAWEVADERAKRAKALCGNLTEDEIDQLIALLEKLLGPAEEKI